jgi:RNA recognition motif-containing protein
MKLYVGNLSFQSTKEDIQDLFSQHGQVTDVHLILDRETQRPRGFAFVTFANGEDGQRAITALDGQSFDGRNLTVNEARPMEPRSGGGGGGGGGGGRREFSGGRREGGFRDRR